MEDKREYTESLLHSHLKRIAAEVKSMNILPLTFENELFNPCVNNTDTNV